MRRGEEGRRTDYVVMEGESSKQARGNTHAHDDAKHGNDQKKTSTSRKKNRRKTRKACKFMFYTRLDEIMG